MSQRALKRDLRLADERCMMLGRAITTLKIYGFVSDNVAFKMRTRLQKLYKADVMEAHQKANQRKQKQEKP